MKYALFACVFSALLLSCKKEKQASEFCFDGIVKWMGEPAADGLGWVLYKGDSLQGSPYIPQNLPDGFKVNDRKVSACVYQTEEKFSCFCIRPLNTYRITSIKPR